MYVCIYAIFIPGSAEVGRIDLLELELQAILRSPRTSLKMTLGISKALGNFVFKGLSDGV